jgi:hypothetical protein
MSKDSRRRAIQAARQAEARRQRRRWAVIGGAAAAAIALAVAIPLATASGGTGPGGTGSGSAGSGSAGSGSAGSGSAGSGGTPSLTLKPLSTLGTLGAAPAPGADGSEGVPVPSAPALTAAATKATGQTVDGIGCDTSEQTLFHIHAHLTIMVNGKPRQIPYGIGIPGDQPTQTPTGPFVETGNCFYWLHTHAPDGIIHIESPVKRTYTLGDFFDEWGQPLSSSRVGPDRGHVTALFNGQVYEGNPRDIPLNAHAQIQLEVGGPLVAPERITFPNGL